MLIKKRTSRHSKKQYSALHSTTCRVILAESRSCVTIYKGLTLISLIVRLDNCLQTLFKYMFHYGCHNGNSTGLHKPPQNSRRQKRGMKAVPHRRSTNIRLQRVKFSPWATQSKVHMQSGNSLLLTRSCYRFPVPCDTTTEERHHGSMSIWFRNSA